MKLTKERQKATGAFYTPKWVAEKAVEYMSEILPTFEGFMFYDCAAGEGALLDALPENCEKYGTTLEWEDVQILREKGYTANQFDFLEGDVDKLGMLWDARAQNNLIIVTNPPYLRLPAGEYQGLRDRYKSDDATALFYQKILNDLKPLMLCSFSKTDLFCSPTHKYFRQTFSPNQRLLSSFITQSKAWGLKGDFPIIFSIFLML